MIPAHIRKAVSMRSGGRCERVHTVGMRCWHKATEQHHVLPRGRGGKDEESNLLHLCPMCHHFATTQPRLAEEQGLLRKREFKRDGRVE